MAGVPPNPRMAMRIHRSLVEWRQAVQSRLFYPRMSRKQVSLATVREWERLFGREWELDEKKGGVEFTQETLERIYHDSGVVVEGPCEIRQKWYPSGVVPRSYFAPGGTSFDESKYVQEMAGMLTESLPTTHPITRLNPARIQLKDPSCYLRIYDLTAFTSNHWECKHFIDRLASFCVGTLVTIVDAREGRIQVDLGDLLSDYNHSMNRFPEYSLERIGLEFDGVTEFHNQAGFLGVYGNINFSTYVHGASLLMIVQDDDEANVAGDDAHYKEEPGFEDIADRVIGANGIVEPTKEFRSDQPGAVCLKRGLIQVDRQILPKIMLVFPSLFNIGRLFGYRPPQFAVQDKSRSDLRSLVGNEMFRFLRAVYSSGIDGELDLLHDLLSAIYLSASLPRHGCLPPFGDLLIPALPDDPITLTTISPLHLLLRHHFSGVVTFPKAHEQNGLNESDDPLLVAGSEWDGPSTKHLRYLEVLGYVAKEEITEVLWGIAAWNRVLDVYSGKIVKEYSWTCLADVPEHLILS